jgi:hypothetical protein
MAGQVFAAASALLAGRRGEVQRAGENSRCWEILRATPRGICQKIEPIWWCNSSTRVSKMSFRDESAECGYR